MLVLVHVVPPVEYGRFAAVTGLTGLINVGSCGQFMTQALQLPEGADPHWSRHFSAGLYIQGVLTLICWLTAAVCWSLPTFRPLAPLLLIASLNFILDAFNLLGDISLRRQLNFRRLRIVHAAGTLASTMVSLCLGLNGFGAYAFIIANVFNALPFTVDLLLLRRWRPNPGWWRMPDWAGYRPAFRFGLRQGGAALLSNARSFAESMVLPGSVGLFAMGLWNRAQGLYRSSVGRMIPLLLDALYPVLPRYAADLEQYPRQATLVVQVMLWTTIPLGVFLGVEGPTVSRLLYGQRWIAADPLLWPGALVGIGFSCFSVCYVVLLAANRLKECTLLDVVSGLLLTSAILFPWLHAGMTVYAWMLATAQLAAAALALARARKLMIRTWMQTTLLPPVAAATAAAALTHWCNGRMLLPLGLQAACLVALYGICTLILLRLLFATQLRTLVQRLPLLNRYQHLLLYSRTAAAAAGGSSSR
jgi:O-antigen/teichoic acid export membrane protein